MVIVQEAGVQTCDDDDDVLSSIAPTVAEEVKKTSKELELPDFDEDNSNYGSDYEFS